MMSLNLMPSNMFLYIGQYSSESLGLFTPWISSFKALNLHRERPIQPVVLGKKNDFFRIEYHKDKTLSDWAKYLGTRKLRDVPEDRFNENSCCCVVYADEFLINDNDTGKGHLKLRRRDGQPIPMAAMARTKNKIPGRHYPTFQLFTHTSYPVLNDLGCDISPCILSEGDLENWMDMRLPPKAKRELLRNIPEFTFDIERLDSIDLGASSTARVVWSNKLLGNL